MQNTVVFNLFPFRPDFWLPNAFLVSLDRDGKPAHIRQKAVFENLKDWEIEATPALEKCFQIIGKLTVAELEKRFSPPKAKKPDPLEKLLADQLIKKTIEQFVHREMDIFLRILPENNLFLTKNAERKVIAAELLIEPGDDLHAHFFFKKTDDGLQYRLGLAAENEKVWLPKTREIDPLTNQPGWLLVGQKLHRLPSMRGWLVKPFLQKEVVEVKRASMQEYFKKFILAQADRADLDRIETEGFDIKIAENSAICRLELVQLPLGDHPWAIRPTFEYAGAIDFFWGEKRPHRTRISFEKTDDISLIQTRRDFEKEAGWILFLKEKGLAETEPFRLQLIGNQSFMPAIDWLATYRAELEKANFKIVEPYFEDKKICLATAKINLKNRRENDWFDLFGEVEIGEFRIAFSKFLKNIRSGDRFFQLPDGSFWPMPEEWFSRFEMIALFGKEIADGLRLSKKHEPLAQEIFMLEKLAQPIDFQFVTSNFSPSEKLEAQLYPYQLEGFRWLAGHLENGSGALLADEMGLGKTLQTIALLQFSKEKNGQKTTENTPPTDARLQLDLFKVFEETIRPMRALIVAPASILFNWEREIARFAPNLFVYRHAGPGRHRSARDLSGQDIVLTTYQTVLSDVELLQKIDWQTVVLDEAHFVKNRLGETAKALRTLPAKSKIALTGTPVENRLADFYAQMDWLNPGLLGSASFFQEHFAGPIERNANPRRLEILRKMSAPFVLRRTKNLVAADLPPLTEKFIFCEMPDAQRSFYEQEKSAVRNLLTQPDLLTGLNYGRQVLPALMRLRQLACHPVLVKKEFEDASGKFSAVVETWREIAENGQKVLIFSSFVEHLRLFRQFFEKEKIQFGWLTGESSAAERQRAVDDFSKKSDVRVMLSSLKAGGVGLNLTAAEYVFLLDPWWNPAAERQAIARAHRGGQELPVVAVRFVSRDSIEEKIVELQRRKERLFADLFDFEGEPTLAQEDLLFLLG